MIDEYRDKINEIFRNPENGTPEKISAKGCLALAKLGKNIWNLWRSENPAKAKHAENGIYAYENAADFRKQNFEGILINLEGFNFGDGALFNESVWGNNTNFNNAIWGKDSKFYRVKWGDNCSFEDAIWGNGCKFNESSWQNYLKLDKAKWGDFCDFDSSEWGKFSIFFQVVFGNYTTFNNCKFANMVCFDYTEFKGITTFVGSTFEGGVRFIGKPKESFFHDISFAGCHFKGAVDFGQRSFKGPTTFSSIPKKSKLHLIKLDTIGDIVYGQHIGIPIMVEKENIPRLTIFSVAPNFHGCELNQDTSFDGVIFPKAQGTEKSARAYRTLKLAFSKQQAVKEEQRFFKLEMDEEAKIAFSFRKKYPWIGQRPLFLIYKGISDYGYSVGRPLILLILSLIIFSTIYSYYDDVCFFFEFKKTCSLNTDAMLYGIIQILPLLGLAKKDFLDELNIPILFIIFQKIISYPLLFLIGLALRNAFRIK